MNCKFLFTLAMSMVLLVGCEDSKSKEDSKPEVTEITPEVEDYGLHQLCMSSDAPVSQVQEFLRLGGDVNKESFDGRTLLEAHVKDNDSPEMISVLLEAGADVNGRDGSDLVPLVLAARFNDSIEVISVLIEAGADVKVPDESGNTPPMLAAKHNTNPRNQGLKQDKTRSTDRGNGSRMFSWLFADLV